MNGDGEGHDTSDVRLASLVQFGFSEAAMNDFLSEHSDAFHERLVWLEQRRETATEIEERLNALSQTHRLSQTLSDYATQLSDPFTVEEVYLAFERDVRTVAPWEPALNQSRSAWFEREDGDAWYALYDRLARLDLSSHAAIVPLHRLFSSPERVDELMRHLGTVEADEARQVEMIEAGAQRLRARGYAVEELDQLPLLEGLRILERWQAFHAEKEHVRLGAVQMIQPFDAGLAIELEARCHALQDVNDASALEDLSNEIQALSQTLEERRQVLSDVIQGWRGRGIIFPHEGELHPNDLMQWEANHDEVAHVVERHLSLIERWERFARYWPSQTEVSSAYIGHLDQTDRLRDAVDEMDTLWKKLELDGLELLETYEHAGLGVSEWRQRIFDDPMNAMERMTVERQRWDARVALIEQFNTLDTSFSGEEEVVLRQQLLATEDVGRDVLDEMEAFIERFTRRVERHRVMLEEELAALRRSGRLEHEARTTELNLVELERHVAHVTRSNGAYETSSQPSMVHSKMRASIASELESLRQAGWGVDKWLAEVKDDPLQVARALSDARPHLQRHDVLRRRLLALPWKRDVKLALEVEMMSQQPHWLAHLNLQIPNYTTHLASRAIEDEGYELQLWQPPIGRPTLMPIPEHRERKVLQPASALEEAHEAMLEAMDAGEEQKPLDENEDVSETVAKKPAEPLEQPVSPQVEKEKKEPIEEVLVSEEAPTEAMREAIETEKRLHEDGLTDDEFFELTDDKSSVERYRWWREQQAALEKEDGKEEAKSTEASATTLVEVNPADGTKKALTSLTNLVAVLGLSELATSVEQGGLEALQDVRRSLAGQVNVAPRDVRIARLLRLSLRLLPAGDEDDNERARLLAALSDLVPTLKRWTRRRLEARHSGSKGNFLADAVELGVALERIPGLGQRLPLEEDNWPLPSDMAGLTTEVSKLAQSVNLPSAGGVKA